MAAWCTCHPGWPAVRLPTVPSASLTGTSPTPPPAASYDFLHDVAPCAATRARSPYRQAMFSKFWSHLQAMRHSDQLLEHLHSFSSSPTLYTVPEVVRSGGPLFYLSETTGAPEPFSG